MKVLFIYSKMHLQYELLMKDGAGMSMLDGAGTEAAQVIQLWWVLFGIAALVFFGVCLFLAAGHLRFRQDKAPPSERTLGRAVASASIITIVLLFVIILADFRFSQPFKEVKKAGVTIEVVGKLWWWEVTYLDDDGSRLFTTANEIHIPVNVPVKLKLITDNVIHSFWVPNLGGKIDMIPGRVNEMWIEAKRTGTFRGQCAEFCGKQHTLMAFLVEVQEKEDYASWINAQMKPAIVPEDLLGIRGQEVFKEARCTKCHIIRGIYEEQNLGPDLTHLAGRKTLASATLDNNKGHLAGWITDPQELKPGNLMPATALSPEDLHALLHYLNLLR